MVPVEGFRHGGQRAGTDDLALEIPPEYRPYLTWPQADEASGFSYHVFYDWARDAKDVIAAVAEAKKRADAAKAARAGGGGGLAGSATGLDPEFKRRFDEWNASLGNLLSITSGFRSYEEQAYLYDLYLSGQGNLAAPPGSSMHERGLAIDHSRTVVASTNRHRISAFTILSPASHGT